MATFSPEHAELERNPAKLTRFMELLEAAFDHQVRVTPTCCSWVTFDKGNLIMAILKMEISEKLLAKLRNTGRPVEDVVVELMNIRKI